MASPVRRAILLLGLGIASCVAGCATPTLPLPPPEPAPLTEPDAEGMVTVGGTARAAALVFVFNEDAEEGVITVADGEGSFLARIAAVTGDTLTLWQRVGTDDGQQVSLEVP